MRFRLLIMSIAVVSSVGVSVSIFDVASAQRWMRPLGRVLASSKAFTPLSRRPLFPSEPPTPLSRRPLFPSEPSTPLSRGVRSHVEPSPWKVPELAVEPSPWKVRESELRLLEKETAITFSKSSVETSLKEKTSYIAERLSNAEAKIESLLQSQSEHLTKSDVTEAVKTGIKEELSKPSEPKFKFQVGTGKLTIPYKYDKGPVRFEIVEVNIYVVAGVGAELIRACLQSKEGITQKGCIEKGMAAITDWIAKNMKTTVVELRASLWPMPDYDRYD